MLVKFTPGGSMDSGNVCNFYFMINDKTIDNSTNTKARGKISIYLESSEF
jgi:hypothetical protein